MPSSPADADQKVLEEWGAWWRDDLTCPSCKACGIKFSTFRRRHHCRGCGHVFCDSCSGTRKELPQLTYVGVQRVCRRCNARDFEAESKVLREKRCENPHACTDLLRNCAVEEQPVVGPSTMRSAEEQNPADGDTASRASLHSCEDWDDWDIGEAVEEPEQPPPAARSPPPAGQRARGRSVVVPNLGKPVTVDEPAAAVEASAGSQVLALPAGFADAVGPKSGARAISGFNFGEHTDVLQRGGSLFSIRVNVGTALQSRDAGLIAALINRTAFEDEERDNAAPVFDMESPSTLSQYIFLLTKAAYVLPGVTSKHFTLGLMSDPSYHRSCQPSSSEVWVPGVKWPGEPDTFRITKTLIPCVLKMTIQFRVSELPAELYPALQPLCDGYRIDKALLLERTKRNKSVSDSTKKAKSILLYHDIPGGGVMCTNVTVAANTSLPTIAARMLDRFGSMGAGEVAVTAEKTRAHLKTRFPECMPPTPQTPSSP